MLNQAVCGYLEQNLQYKTRMKTDVFFPFGTSFCLGGIVDDMAWFIQENQLKDRNNWKFFVNQFRNPVDGPFNSWKGEFFGKMMRGACITYQYTKDEELYAVLQDVISDMLTTQGENGRYSSYAEDKDFGTWDMWCRKYVLLGLLHFHEICKDQKLRETVLKSAAKHLDHILTKVGDGDDKRKITATSGIYGGVNSSSILEPVVRMYNATGEKRYLEFATHIVESGACADGNIFELAYENKKMPYMYPVVKAYEMMSCFEGLLEYYRVTGIEKWKTACVNFAKSIMASDITITGSAGCEHELFNNSAVTQTLTTYRGRMQETCVTVTWIKFCMQLLCMTGDIVFAEEIEKAIFNGLYGSVNRQKSSNNGGFMFDSYSPLLKYHRGIAIGGLQTLDGIAIYGCCTAIGAAGTGFAPQFVMQTTKKGVVFNTYAEGDVQAVTPKNQAVRFCVDTEYPTGDDIAIALSLGKSEKFDIMLRIPAFADSATVSINGKSETAEPGAYLTLSRTWETGDVIEICLAVTPKIIHALNNPKDKNGKKHIAIKRGALVLARDSQVTPDVGEPFHYKKEIFLKRIDSVDLPTQCQYIVSSDKGDATIMIDYASAGKTLDKNSEMECWFPTEEF